MRKLFVILAVTVIVTLLTSCFFPFGVSSAQKDADVLSGNDVTLADVTVNVDSRDFSTTEFNFSSCPVAVQVESNSCGITVEAAP